MCRFTTLTFAFIGFGVFLAPAYAAGEKHSNQSVAPGVQSYSIGRRCYDEYPMSNVSKHST